MLDRRTFLLGASAATATALSGVGASFASAPTENRLVLLVLRGGLDGLHALVPYGDKDYRRLRPRLAIGAPGADGGALDIDGHFGLHPALSPLHGLFRARELLLIPASSTRYRQRSHFDGQNMLENGSARPYGASDGWLNRAILGLNGGDRRLGLALGPAVPLILQGEARVQTWANTKLPKVDDDFLMRIARIYGNDPLFAMALAEARGSQKPKMNANAMGDAAPASVRELKLAAGAAADLLARTDGPRIAVMEIQGWDTHFRQEARLATLFARFSTAVETMKAGLGEAWAKTAMVVVSEFGRTAAENGSGGTDHGSGGIAMLAGGAVAGGRIAGRWPGLSEKALFEGRDVNPVNDYESIFKSVLTQHLGLGLAFVEDSVFPASGASKPLEGLFRIS